jgi:ABC-2 type transport system ATP-binding protein
MGEQSLVDVSKLHRRYGDLQAVRGLTFQVHRGEVLGLLGPNGAGKTSTMQMVSGVLAPSEGAVSIGGFDLLDHPVQAKARLGYLPERAPLYRDMTVDEYLGYCARLRGLRSQAMRSAVDEAKSRCGLGDNGRRLIDNLSKGYQQRVGIAQAIVHRPAVVVLDEPTVGLDPIQIREIRALIRELGGEHGVILSTHVLPEVQAVCDRVLIIHLGRLVLDEQLSRMNAEQLSACTRIGLRRAPGIEVLERLPGVHRVDGAGAGTFRLHHDPLPEFTEHVARAAAEGDWGLYELVSEARSLEEIFVELTCGEGDEDDSEIRDPGVATR